MVSHTLIAIDCRRIEDWSSFHSVFAEILGFPEFYGRNMDAWVDCLTYVDESDDGMTKIHAPKDGVLVLQLNDFKDFAARCPEISKALIESSSFVNWRRIEQGASPVLALSFWE
jgi:hypothetical protein